MNCEYIFRCTYSRKGKEAICKNSHVSCHCDYWQGLKAEDVKAKSDLEKKLDPIVLK